MSPETLSSEVSFVASLDSLPHLHYMTAVPSVEYTRLCQPPQARNAYVLGLCPALSLVDLSFHSQNLALETARRVRLPSPGGASV